MLVPLSLEPEPVSLIEPRWRTRWPLAQVIDPADHVVPWAQAGRLLARLHRALVTDADAVLETGGPRGLQRALGRLSPGSPESDVILRAARGLPLEVWRSRPGRPATIVHGDWHLGQMGRLPTETDWRLLDIDDVGVGDPLWDLSRPAGFWAAGLLTDVEWEAFLHAYRDAAGPAVPPAPTDPWGVLDPIARAAVIRAAAADPRGAGEDQAMLLSACARMPA